VSPPPRAWFAEKADAQEKQMREDHPPRAQQNAEQAACRLGADERLQADQAPQRDTA
jgi:hypothetical protein